MARKACSPLLAAFRRLQLSTAAAYLHCPLVKLAQSLRGLLQSLHKAALARVSRAETNVFKVDGDL